MSFVPRPLARAAPIARRAGQYRIRIAILGATLLVVLSAVAPRAAHAEVSIEAVDPARLRVCADPEYMPFSNDKGEGFENKIAELFAKELGLPLEYTWHPQGGTFIRNTLGEKRCDLIMGVPAGSGAVLNTNPYLRMTYVMVYRKDSGITARNMADPAMKKLTIGTIAGSPPNFLIAENDLLTRIHPYPLRYDARFRSVAQDMVNDLKNDVTDVALMAGPDAGYWLKRENLDAAVIPLKNAKHPFGHMDYYITMGVRPGENDWKRKINKLMDQNQDGIDKILRSYGIPILPMRGPITPVAEGEAAPPAAKPSAATKDSAPPGPPPQE